MMRNDANRRKKPGKPKILLVQEHIPTAISLAALLTQRGCEVESAADGKRAIQLVQECDFDLLALDSDLPDGGFETFLLLRQLPSLSATPIVFIARRSNEANWLRGLELGATDYIEKPLEGTAFVRRILSHIKSGSRPNWAASETP
jgi:DNA-binding response OmpR family regulator